MAVSVGFTLSPGRAPTGSVGYNGANFNFDLSRNSNVSNSSNAPQNYAQMLNMSSSSGSVANNYKPTLNKPNITVGSSSSSNTSSGDSSDLTRIMSFVSPFVGAAVNYALGSQSNDVNQSIANANMEAIAQANRENIAFQREENAIARSREDNAFQRAAKDLQLAGLSKSLAAGSPASASSMSAPQVNPVTNDFNYKNPMGNIDLANTFMSAFKTMSDIDNNRKLTDAQVRSLDANSNYTNIGAKTLYEKNKSDIAYTRQLMVASEESSKYTALQSHYLLKYGDKENLAKIDKYTSDAVLNYSSARLNSSRLEEISQNIAESIARTSKIGKEEEKLIKDIAYTELQLKIAEYNLGVSQELSIRTSDSLPSILGLPVGAFSSGFGNVSRGLLNWAVNSFVK